MPHLYTSIPWGRQALCMKDSHISLQFNIVLSGFPPHLKQYSSLFVRSQIWHLNTLSTICACVRHLMEVSGRVARTLTYPEWLSQRISLRT